jgi:cysteine desulfurase/selenocysteine lyase
MPKVLIWLIRVNFMTGRIGGAAVFPPAENYVYLDAASVALTNKDASDVAVRWQQRLAEEGTIAFDEQAEVECFDNLNAAAAALFNTQDDNIAIASSETVLMASLAWAVAPQRKSNIVTTDITHPSTIYPWMRVAESTGAELRWARAVNQYVDPDQIESLVDEQTSVICLSHVEYGTGQVYDLRRFADLAHAVGALCIVDVTQSAGQVPVDMQKTGVDAVVCSSYKWLCGPFGAGIMAISEPLMQLQPGIVGWRSHKDMWDFQATRLEYADTAKRYEFGTMAYGVALATTESVNFLLQQSIDVIADHNRAIANQLLEGLAEQGAEILSPDDPQERSAIVAAKFANRDSRELVAAMKKQDVVASLRGDHIRFSPHLYNNSDDIARALAVTAGLV